MSSPPFVTIRCPACGSADVRPQAAGRFACQYCESNFLYTGANDNPGPAPSFAPGSGGRPVAAARSVAVLILVISAVMLVFGVAFFMLFFAAAEEVVTAVVAPMSAAADHRTAPAGVPTVVPSSPPPVPSRPPSTIASRPSIAPPAEVAPEHPAEPEPLVLSDYQRLVGCECSAKTAGRIVELRARGRGNTTTISGDGVQVAHELEFVLAATGEDPWRLPAAADTAPAASYAANQITLGIGCKGDTVVIAAGTTISAWSSTPRTLLWSRTLPGPFGAFGARPGTDLELDCETLRLTKDAVTVRTGGRSVRLSLVDGVTR